jgi:hypothetical protein
MDFILQVLLASQDGFHSARHHGFLVLNLEAATNLGLHCSLDSKEHWHLLETDGTLLTVALRI